jgi:hypothetical protein
MKYFSFIFLVFVALSCGQTQQKPVQTQKVNSSPTGNLGDEVSSSASAVPANRIADVFTGSDTAVITISGKISASCQHTGCWMDLDMGNQKNVHVTFRDDSFTIPLDAAGKNVIAEGTAIRELIPVETLRNYARDDGQSEEEVAAITKPAYIYKFIADGVLIEE